VRSAAHQPPLGSAADTASNKAALDYDTFLTLLVQQMKNQDPTEPMDATEQIAQLATFSQVEQTIQTNKNLENLLQSSTSQSGRVDHRAYHHQRRREPSPASSRKFRSILDGLVAVLESGKKVLVGAGVTIS
jgi:flagellar basal-body rod modification protein FlgD